MSRYTQKLHHTHQTFQTEAEQKYGKIKTGLSLPHAIALAKRVLPVLEDQPIRTHQTVGISTPSNHLAGF